MVSGASANQWLDRVVADAVKKPDPDIGSALSAAIEAIGGEDEASEVWTSVIGYHALMLTPVLPS
jgi:hypothetical protein